MVSGEEEIVVYISLRCHAVKISRGMSLRSTSGRRPGQEKWQKNDSQAATEVSKPIYNRRLHQLIRLEHLFYSCWESDNLCRLLFDLT